MPSSASLYMRIYKCQNLNTVFGTYTWLKLFMTIYDYLWNKRSYQFPRIGDFLLSVHPSFFFLSQKIQGGISRQRKQIPELRWCQNQHSYWSLFSQISLRKEQTETITERKLKVLEKICGDKCGNKLFHWLISFACLGTCY